MFYINTIKKLKEDNAALMAKFSELMDVSIERNQAMNEFMETFSEYRLGTETTTATFLDTFEMIRMSLEELTRVQSALVETHHNRALLDGTLNPKKK